MRTASEGLLFDVLVQAHQFPIMKTEFFNDNNEWERLDDIMSITVEEEGTKNAYTIFNVVPLSSTRNIKLQNY